MQYKDGSQIAKDVGLMIAKNELDLRVPFVIAITLILIFVGSLCVITLNIESLKPETSEAFVLRIVVAIVAYIVAIAIIAVSIALAVRNRRRRKEMLDL